MQGRPDMRLNAWTPPLGTIDHRGVPLSGNLVFFEPPPPEIGEVISASSTMPTKQAARAWRRRRAASVIRSLFRRDGGLQHLGYWGIGLTAVLLFISFGMGLDSNSPWLMYPAIVVTLLGLISLFSLARKFFDLCLYMFDNTQPTCRYVGVSGIARFRAKTWRRPADQRVFLFANAEKMDFSAVETYRLLPLFRIYHYTTYRAVWSASSGQTAFALVGIHFFGKAEPPEDDEWHFACSAAAGWRAAAGDCQT